MQKKWRKYILIVLTTRKTAPIRMALYLTSKSSGTDLREGKKN